MTHHHPKLRSLFHQFPSPRAAGQLCCALFGAISLILVFYHSGLGASNQETILEGEITAPLKLTADGNPHKVNGQLLVSSVLRVEPGVELIFSPGASLRITADGSVGSSIAGAIGSGPIVFRGLSNTPGTWQGIVAEQDSTLVLTGCEVSGAKIGIQADAEIIQLDGCILHDNELGLALSPNEIEDQWLRNLIIVDNTGHALKYFMSPGVLTSNIAMIPPFVNLTVLRNGRDAVQVDPSLTGFAWQWNQQPAQLKLASPETEDGQRLPLDLGWSNAGANQSLHFEAGSRVHIPGIRVHAGGELVAEGRPAEPITFHPPQGKTNWDGVALAAGSSALINHCEVTGVDSVLPAMAIGSSDVSVSHCTLHHNGGVGMSFTEAGISPIVDAVTITDNGDDAIQQSTPDMNPRMHDLVVADNGRDGIAIYGRKIAGDVTLDSLIADAGALPIYTTGMQVTTGASLTIMPGSKLYFDDNARLTIESNGIFSATDVLLTSESAEPGSWRGIEFEAGARAHLEGCDIGYAGVANALSGVLTILATDVVVRSCRLHHGGNHGIQLIGDGLTPLFEDLRLEDNMGAAVSEWNKANETMDPTYRGLTAKGNGRNGIVVETRNLYADAYWESPGVAGDGALPYIVPEMLSIVASATLTIADDAVIQFADPRGTGYLGVQGRLVATGATFRGEKAEAGSWAGIQIRPKGTAELRRCQILFAGSASNLPGQPTALRIDTTAPVSVHLCTIRDSAGSAVEVAGAAQPDLRWNNIFGNASGINAAGLAASALDSQAGQADARFTWWGHASGPANSPDNEAGRGDRVQGNALFTPWAVEPVTEVPAVHNIFLPIMVR